MAQGAAELPLCCHGTFYKNEKNRWIEKHEYIILPCSKK
jgi:hypothetical protein